MIHAEKMEFEDAQRIKEKIENIRENIKQNQL